MWHDVCYAFWFFWPAGMANMAPILITKAPFVRDWKTPMDFGIKYRGKQLFGSNKTWRGFVIGVLTALVFFLGMQQLGHHLGSFTPYLSEQGYFSLPWYIGAVLGAGTIVGDAVESFFKRQRDIPPGSSWYPLDQIDYIIGACLFSLPLVVLPLAVYVWIFIGGFIFHLFFSYVGYLTHFKHSPI